MGILTVTMHFLCPSAYFWIGGTDLTILLNNILSLLAIVFVEIRDFLMGRLDEIFYVLSKGLRFTFTSIFGQVVGLIWRGVIEGLKK